MTRKLNGFKKHTFQWLPPSLRMPPSPGHTHTGPRRPSPRTGRLPRLLLITAFVVSSLSEQPSLLSCQRTGSCSVGSHYRSLCGSLLPFLCISAQKQILPPIPKPLPTTPTPCSLLINPGVLGIELDSGGSLGSSTPPLPPKVDLKGRPDSCLEKAA